MAKQQIGAINWDSYDQLIKHKLQIDEMIYTLNANDLPLQTGAGSNGRAIVPTAPVSNRVFSWMDEDNPVPIGHLNGAIADGVATAVIVDDNQAVNFPVDSTVLVEDELMLVTAINTATHTLTVTRGVNGTSGVAHADNLEIRSIGTSLAEGSIGQGAFRGRDEFENYTQILSRQVKTTGTELIIPKYGVPSELARQIVNQGNFISKEVEFAMALGVKYNDSATSTRSTGGINSWLTAANDDSTNTWMTVDRIEAQQQLVYDLGGQIEILMSKPQNFRALNNGVGSERVNSQTIEDERRGRYTATTVLTEFGEVELVRNRWMRDADAWGYSTANVIKRVARPMQLSQLAVNDDTVTYLLLEEMGMEVKGPEHMLSFSALDSTQALPGAGLA